jgi:pyridoxamine 5'-phosphate oxidase
VIADTPEPAWMRRDYGRAGLARADLADDWLTQFQRWFAEAVAAGLPEPNAMVAATADSAGRPSARTVLLKGYDERGLVFYTNYESRKGRDLTENPRASLLFPWHPLRRQVRIEGLVTRISHEETAEYFSSRPYGSRIGAWASRQSAVVRSREELDARYEELAARWPEDPPVPDFWGGYRVAPVELEFWQGQLDRMHDRLRYRRTRPGWVLERLAP